MYILDTEVLIALPGRAAVGNKNALLDAVCDQILGAKVTFPDMVAKECYRIAEPDHASWVKAVSGSCASAQVAYSRVLEVVGDCPEAMDFDDAEEPSQIYVLATAYELRAHPGEVVVVTGEWLPLPDRLPLSEVCERLNIKCCNLDEFLHQIDLSGLL